MNPASSTGGGMCANTPPDSCKTPTPSGTPPIPYPNTGQCTQATGFSNKVKFVQKNAIHVMSEIPMSSGDEAGTAGGVSSGVNMNKIQWKKGSSKVKVEGNQVAYSTTTTGHNGSSSNITGTQASPSQMKVKVAP